MLKACAALLSVPRGSQTFPHPPKNSIGFWPSEPLRKTDDATNTEINIYVQNSFLSFSFFLTFIWYSIIATLV